MLCPHCKRGRLKVLRTNHTLVGVTRRRECRDCGRRFTTKEVVSKKQLQVMKSGNRRAEPFEEGKIIEVVLGITKGFTVSKQQAEGLAQDVRTALLEKGKTVVTSEEVRATLAGCLREFSPVAHERFEALSRGTAGDEVGRAQYRLFSSDDPGWRRHKN